MILRQQALDLYQWDQSMFQSLLTIHLQKQNQKQNQMVLKGENADGMLHLDRNSMFFYLGDPKVIVVK